MIEEVKNFDMKVFLAFMRVINDEKRREFLLRGRNMLTTTLESQYEEEEKS